MKETTLTYENGIEYHTFVDNGSAFGAVKEVKRRKKERFNVALNSLQTTFIDNIENGLPAKIVIDELEAKATNKTLLVLFEQKAIEKLEALGYKVDLKEIPETVTCDLWWSESTIFKPNPARKELTISIPNELLEED